MHEKRMHTASSFVTLTYDQASLPASGSLDRSHPQLFLKRVRKHFFPGKVEYGKGLRFFGCGEYGDNTNRAHYHILFFNIDFPDKRFYKSSKSGEPLWTSALLNKLWGYGNCPIGAVTFESCAYVAAYCTKKINGKMAADHYQGRLPEFPMFSLKPGIGSTWFEKHHTEAFKHDNVIMSGRECGIPRYYDLKYDEIDQNMRKTFRVERTDFLGTDESYNAAATLVDSRRLARLKKLRRKKINRDDTTPERMRTRHRFAELKAKRFKREI